MLMVSRLVKSTQITEALCGLDISSSQVSRLSAAMDEELEGIPPANFVIVLPMSTSMPAMKKVRHGGNVRDLAVLLAVGANPGKAAGRYWVYPFLYRKQRSHWRAFPGEFYRSVVLQGVKTVSQVMITAGLRAARQSVFPLRALAALSVSIWPKNAQSYIPKVRLKKVPGRGSQEHFSTPHRKGMRLS
jgi:putative transposase